MKDILILLYQGKSPISRLIRWQTRSIYSHASIYIVGEGNLEAWHVGGVRLVDKFYDGHKPDTLVDVFKTKVTPRATDLIVRFAKNQIGKKYDFRSVFRFLTRKPEDENDREKWFCSELVFASFQYGGIDLLKRIEPWAVSPSLLSMSPKLMQVDQWIT